MTHEHETPAARKIVSDPTIMGGVPHYEGTRIPVSRIVAALIDGCTEQEVLDVYPRLTKADIQAVRLYVMERVVMQSHPEAAMVADIAQAVQAYDVDDQTAKLQAFFDGTDADEEGHGGN